MKSLLGAGLFTLIFAFSAACFAQHGPGMDSPLHALAAVKGQLNLNTSQQLQWDNAVAQAKAAHEAAPDLASVATLADGTRQQTESAHRAARDAWLALYATFTPEQKAVVRDTIKGSIARMQARHAGQDPSAPNRN